MPRHQRRSSVTGCLAVLLGLGLIGWNPSWAQQASPAPPSNVVAKVGDRVITVEEVENRLKALPDSVRDQIMKRDNLRTYVKNMLLKELYAREAERRGLDKDPAVRAQLDEARRNVLTNAITGKTLGGLTVTEAEMSAYFQAHQSEFGGKSLPEVKPQVAQQLRDIKSREALEKVEREAAAQWAVVTNDDALKTISIPKDYSRKQAEKNIQETEKRVGPLPEEQKQQILEGGATVAKPTVKPTAKPTVK